MTHALSLGVFIDFNVHKLTFNFLFAFAAAGAEPCGGPKQSPRTSSIVHDTIFYVWSFAISGNILRI